MKRYLFVILPCILVACAAGPGGGTPTRTPIPGLGTVAPTATLAADVRPCRAADLTPGSHSNGAAGSIFLGLWLTNTGATECYLQTWPELTLVDSSGKALEVEYIPWDMNSMTPQAGATEQASAGDTARIGLDPGESVGINLVWRNWCSTATTGLVGVRVALAEGVVSLTTDLQDGGRCDTPSAPSTVSVSSFDYVSRNP